MNLNGIGLTDRGAAGAVFVAEKACELYKGSFNCCLCRLIEGDSIDDV